MRWFVSSTVVCFALALLILGVPRFISSLLNAPAHTALMEIEAEKIPAPGELVRAAVHLERARRWGSSAELAAEIGFVHLLRAAQMDEADPDRKTVAGLATEYLKESLRLSPARPHPWVRLAYARAIEGAGPSEIVALLEQSIKAGPYVGEIAIVRLRKLLAEWEHLSPALRLYAYRQIRWVWRSEYSYLLRAAKDTSRPDIMRFALRPIPGAVERFDRAVPRIAN